jgi:amino acid transporter
VWFVNASAFGSVMAYLMVAAAFLILRKKEPDLARPFKIKYGVPIAVIVTVMSVGFLLLYTPMGKVSLAWPQEWALILIWLLLGVVFFIWSRIAYGVVSPMERELLIFGEEYSRREFTHE